MLAYPIVFNHAGNIKPPTHDELIHSAISQALLTPIGSRPMFPEFGSRLSRLTYLNQTNLTLSLAKQWTEEALKDNVPEIDVLNVLVSKNGEDMTIVVEYNDLVSGENGTQQVTI